MARFTDVFTDSNSPKENRPVAKKIKNIHYTKLLQSQYQYRDRTPKAIESLADLIKADGKVLEPLVVRKAGPGSDAYELISGHKRCLACKYLVEEENMEEFSFVPCIEENMSDVRAEFAVYSTNGYDEKTPYEIMSEIEGMARLLKEHPEEFPEFAGKGRLVEKLAAKMNMSRSVVSDYQNIAHNLGEMGMESFKEGKVDKSAAVTLASMPEEKQEEILRQGITKREEIKTYVQSQAKEPPEKDICEFYYRNVKNRAHLEKIRPEHWPEQLRECYKNAGGGGGSFSYQGSYRGLRINNYDEITWNRYVKLLLQYLPESEYKAVDEKVSPEAQVEQVPGQDTVLAHPEWLPGDQAAENKEMESAIDNVPTVGTNEKVPQKTNGDVIRAMSDEALAMNMMCPNENGLGDIACDKSDSCNCYECILKWLQQEVRG